MSKSRRPQHRRVHPRWIAAISLCAWHATAWAQSADAESLFDDGDRLMKEGKLAAACDAFEASNRIEQRAGTLIRLGDCREDNHQLASAWSAFKDALTRVRDATKKTIATQKLAEVEPRLSYLTVNVADDNKLDGLEITRNGQAIDPAAWNRPVAIDGGSYAIVAHAPGYKDWTSSTSVPNELGKVAIDVPKLVEAPKPPPPPKPVVAPPIIKIVQAPSPWTTRRQIAVATAAIAVVGLAGGITFGVLADQKQHLADGQCQDPTVPCENAASARALNATAHERAGIANIGYVIAGAAAVTTGVLWLTGKPETHGVAFVPSPHQPMVVVTRSW